MNYSLTELGKRALVFGFAACGTLGITGTAHADDNTHDGWGGLETSAEGNVGGSDPTGFMLSLGAGYDFFVSPEWSIGGLGRFTYGALSMNDVSSTLIEPQLLITATYH
jgi:hypothetical protein